MFSSSFITYFLIAFVIGIAISNIAKMIFAFKNRKQEQAFLKIVQAQLADLSGQIERRSMDMQETMNVVNNEYTHMLDNMNPGMKVDYSGSLNDKIALKKYEAEKPNSPTDPAR